MPTLDEIRRWLKGEDVEGLPPRSLAWRDDERERKAKRRKVLDKADSFTDKIAEKSASVVWENERKAKWKVSSDGTDAMIMFGKHKGELISDIAKLDIDYLKWMSKQKFPEELIEIIGIQLSREIILGSGEKIRMIAYDDVDEDDVVEADFPYEDEPY